MNSRFSQPGTWNSVGWEVLQKPSYWCLASSMMGKSSVEVMKIMSSYATTDVGRARRPIWMPGSLCSSIRSKGCRHRAYSTILMWQPCRIAHRIGIGPNVCPLIWIDVAPSYILIGRWRGRWCHNVGWSIGICGRSCQKRSLSPRIAPKEVPSWTLQKLWLLAPLLLHPWSCFQELHNIGWVGGVLPTQDLGGVLLYGIIFYSPYSGVCYVGNPGGVHSENSSHNPSFPGALLRPPAHMALYISAVSLGFSNISPNVGWSGQAASSIVFVHSFASNVSYLFRRKVVNVCATWCVGKVMRLVTLCTNRQRCCLPVHTAS